MGKLNFMSNLYDTMVAYEDAKEEEIPINVQNSEMSSLQLGPPVTSTSAQIRFTSNIFDTANPIIALHQAPRMVTPTWRPTNTPATSTTSIMINSTPRMSSNVLTTPAQSLHSTTVSQVDPLLGSSQSDMIKTLFMSSTDKDSHP